MPKSQKSSISASLMVLLSLFAATVCAGPLAGTITYKTSSMSAPASLTSALVSAYRVGSRTKSVTRTNSAGFYRFSNLPVGQYLVLIEKNGKRLYQGTITVGNNSQEWNLAL